MAKQISLRARLTLLVLGTVLPLAAVGFLASWFLYESYAESNSIRIVRLARSILNSTEARLTSVIGAAEVLALSPTLHARDFLAFRSQAEAYLKKHLPGSTLVVTDRKQ